MKGLTFYREHEIAVAEGFNDKELRSIGFSFGHKYIIINGDEVEVSFKD